jgi:hypothetical protein
MGASAATGDRGANLILDQAAEVSLDSSKAKHPVEKEKSQKNAN